MGVGENVKLYNMKYDFKLLTREYTMITHTFIMQYALLKYNSIQTE